MVPNTPAFSAPSAATVAPGPPQCAEVKPINSPAASEPMVVRVHMVSPLTTMPAPPPIGILTSAAAARPGEPSAATSRATIPTKKPRCALRTTPLPSVGQTSRPAWPSLIGWGVCSLWHVRPSHDVADPVLPEPNWPSGGQTSAPGQPSDPSDG